MKIKELKNPKIKSYREIEKGDIIEVMHEKLSFQRWNQGMKSYIAKQVEGTGSYRVPVSKVWVI